MENLYGSEQVLVDKRLVDTAACALAMLCGLNPEKIRAGQFGGYSDYTVLSGIELDFGQGSTVPEDRLPSRIVRFAGFGANGEPLDSIVEQNSPPDASIDPGFRAAIATMPISG